MFPWLRAAFGAALLLSASGFAAAAQDVTLRSLDGSVELDGTLIGFDGEYFRVDTVYGPLTITAEGVSCAGPGCPDLEAYVAEARFAGAAIIAETLLPALIEAFASDRGMRVSRQIEGPASSTFTLIRDADGTTAARFTLAASTTDGGFEALLNRDTDLALALREPSEVELSAARAADQGDLSLDRRARILGLDALVPLVAPGNPVRSITLPELAAVVSGEIRNWQALGGPDAPIAVHMPAAGSGLSQLFEDRVLVPSGIGPVPGIIRHTDLRDLSDAVARDAYAIGLGAFSALGNARALALGGPCGFSQMPDAASLKAEDYPLTAPLFVYTPARRLPQLVRDFLSFFESRTAERVVRRTGFVNQNVTRSPLAAQGTRLANAIAAASETGEVRLADLQALTARMTGTERLSPTFRFAGGATELDAQSRSSVSRLARAIERGDFDGRQLIFVGFSDGEGSAAANLALSRQRAESVRSAVIEAAAAADLGRVELVVDAFGEAMPMACDDTDWGRAVNRRVEVWLD